MTGTPHRRESSAGLYHSPRVDDQLPTDLEIERALRRAWFPVARMADLEKPRRVDLLGETLVAYLTDSGDPRVATDRCAHRGASLADGHVDGDRIVCPYHGWEWRGHDGRCVHIPSLGDGAGIPSKALLPAYRAEERWGLVWCCLDDPAVELPSPPALVGLEWTHAPGRPMTVSAGPRAATENFRDVAHFPFVHHSTMGHLPEAVEPLQVERRGSEVFLTREYSAQGGNEGMWQDQMTFTYHAIAPCFVCLRMEHGSEGAGGTRYLLNAPSPHTSPTNPDRPRTTIFWVEGLTPGHTNMTLDQILDAEARVYEEDNPILDRLEPGEAPLDPAAQVHTPADRYTLEYRRAFVEFVRSAQTYDASVDGAGLEATATRG
jgi:phenylpropionate dioxygenase-like ring-hydroxylating dioxygenase large terminal subunit